MDDYIEIRWTVADVLEVDDTLTVDEARRVLQYVKHHHDANYGITWDTIEYAIEDLREEGELNHEELQD